MEEKENLIQQNNKIEQIQLSGNSGQLLLMASREKPIFSTENL